MKSLLSRFLCLCLACVLLFGLGSPVAFADGEEGAEEAAEPAITAVRVYVDGLLTARAYRCGGEALLPLETLCGLLGLDCTTEWDAESGVLRMSAHGFSLEADAGQAYFCVNGRYLYNPAGFRLIDGKACFPAEPAARIFTLDIRDADDGESLELDTAEMAVLSGGVTYYSDTYGSEELFWLARIISAEAGHQSMDGLIGVGNVVLNRMKSEAYPDSIHDVIFDGFQFEPVQDGHVYREPTEASVIAACLCLEGYNTAGESLYFIDPRYADDSWLRYNRTFVVTLGTHDFYA